MLLKDQQWIIGGDFNLIRPWKIRKEGVHDGYIESDFKELIDQLHLIDILLKGGWYTWSNRRGGTTHVAECLDRFLVLEAFYQAKQAISVDIHLFYGLDHWPISLRWDNSMTPHPNPLDLKNSGYDTEIHAESNIMVVGETNFYGTRMYQF
jgi:hypothetical protein